MPRYRGWQRFTVSIKGELLPFEEWFWGFPFDEELTKAEAIRAWEHGHDIEEIQEPDDA